MIQLYAPHEYPSKHLELRAYTVAAFRIAQGSDQLSRTPMPQDILEFLLKRRAITYWGSVGRLESVDGAFRLTSDGLAVCQGALRGELGTHNTSPLEVAYWQAQFKANAALPRSASFDDAGRLLSP